MNEKALKTLEYDKIIEMLESCATSTLGKDFCRNLRPLSDLTQIEVMQPEQPMPWPEFIKKAPYLLEASRIFEGL